MARLRLMVLPVLLAACSAGGTQSTASLQDTPLEVAVLPPSAGARIWVNQEAYLALFDVTPGSGIRLLYPRFDRELYRPATAGTWAAGGIYASLGSTNALFASAGSGPRYLFAVASREPLNIETVFGFEDGLRQAFGPATFAGAPLTAMNALLREVVPEQGEQDWATAVYIIYGGEGRRRVDYRNVYRLVLCPDGRYYEVELSQALFVCPPVSDSTPADSVAADSAGIADTASVSPVRRPPALPPVVTAMAGGDRRAALRASESGVVRRPPMPPARRAGDLYRENFRDGRRTGGAVGDLQAEPQSAGWQDPASAMRPRTGESGAGSSSSGTDPRSTPERRENVERP